MKVLVIDAQTISALTTGADLCTIARSVLKPIGADPTRGTASWVMHIDEECVGQTVTLALPQAAGTSDPAENMNPSFFPVATEGSECAAIVNNKRWADVNLEAGYEWALVPTSGNVAQYFVSGVLNSSQTEANDPFAQSEIVSAACWVGDFEQGVFQSNY